MKRRMGARLGVLDGLRGIAILQVLWYHVWLVGRLAAPFPWLQFIPETGLFGVYLFFYLSGFVIVYPFVQAQFAGRPEPAWAHFAWRRAIKIVPSYALSIVAAYAIGFAAVEHTHSTVLEDLVTHALFIHTWWRATFSSINGVLWTLAIEVQFYAIFPLLWWCLKRRPWATGLGLIAFAWALRICAGRFTSPGNAALLAMNLPGYIDLFAFGMLSAWSFVHFGGALRDGRARRIMPFVALAGAATFALALIGFHQGHELWASLPLLKTRDVLGIAFSLLALGALCSPPGFAAALSNPVLRFFAVISYNLYLFNWMIVHELRPLHVSQAGFTALSFACAIAFATLVTYGFERPLLRIPDPGRQKIRLAEAPR